MSELFNEGACGMCVSGQFQHLVSRAWLRRGQFQHLVSRALLRRGKIVGGCQVVLEVKMRDVEDLLIIEALSEGLRRSKRKNKCRGAIISIVVHCRITTTYQGTLQEVMIASTSTLLTSCCSGSSFGLLPSEAQCRWSSYDNPADFLDDYVRMGDNTIIECLTHFVEVVVNVFGEEYLKAPNTQDIDKLMVINSAREFSGMYRSVDCMHSKWDKCPTR
jgi:hypothetical protein